MELYILNKAFETIGVIDTYKSLIWTERFKEVDDFELELPTTVDFLRIGLKPDFYIWSKHTENMMVIEKIELSTEEDDEKGIKITGRGLESILERRLITDLTIAEMDPDAILEFLLKENFTAPKDSARKSDIPKFLDSGVAEFKDLRYSAEFNIGASLLDVVLDICDCFDIGFRAVFEEEGHFAYQFYRGADRSWDQDVLTWTVYSPKFNNLLTTKFNYDNTTYRNYITVYGEAASQTTNPTTGIVYDWPQVTITVELEGATGLDRREGAMDCSDVSRWQGDYILGTFNPKPEEDVTHGWKKLPLYAYQELLRIKAEERMEGYTTTTTYEATADEHMQWTLGKDIFLGDIVEVISEFGLESRCRVDSVIFSHDVNGIRYYPSFTSMDDITTEGGTRKW